MNIQRTLIAAVLAATAATASAQHTAGSSVGNLGYQLIDLAPDDGIAPWIGLDSHGAEAYASVYDQEGNEIDGKRIDGFGTTGFDNNYASLHATAQPDLASVLLTLHSGYGYADANRSFRFTLSPHTQVVFSVDADLWASPEAPGASWPTVLAELYGSLPGFNDGERFMSTLRLAGSAQHGTLSVTASSQDDWGNGILSFNAYAVAESHAAPIPEPAAPALLLGGLAMLAIARRR